VATVWRRWCEVAGRPCVIATRWLSAHHTHVDIRLAMPPGRRLTALGQREVAGLLIDADGRGGVGPRGGDGIQLPDDEVAATCSALIDLALDYDEADPDAAHDS